MVSGEAFGTIRYEYIPRGGQPGDADGDGDVDLDDFVILKSNWGGPGGDCSVGDFDANGSVDLDDFIILKNNWGAGAVPEPASICLLAFGSLAILRRPRPARLPG